MMANVSSKAAVLWSRKATVLGRGVVVVVALLSVVGLASLCVVARHALLVATFLAVPDYAEGVVVFTTDRGPAIATETVAAR